MKDSLAARLHQREVNDTAVRSRSWRKLYSDRRLIQNLDIVNELDGHSGCVNALSWSKSGRLLASGSDDRHLNIHSYQPADTGANNPFQLAATVSTGHTQNIFSVKFMPHSNDRTVITAAGDSQVRIFDLEYAGKTDTASTASTLASEGRRRGRHNLYNGVRYLSDGDTNTRVYRSHGDRVKRIVTESSPHLFLTCSEDGEVRQWDLRQPSSAYPEPHGFHSMDSFVPPPLISYKRYSLDLNTISCSASQPHYIALGGAHLHAFLHDRRMTGRDRLEEMGRPLSPVTGLSADEQDLLGQATQCVKKFAPTGQQRMKRSDHGHITACKISDARPDEMIVSWSGDHIYSFDLLRSPGNEEDRIGSLKSNRVNESRDRKRKRNTHGSESSLAQQRATSARRTTAVSGQETALRIRYQNGQTEDIPIQPRAEMLTEGQRMARRIASATVKIRSLMFERSDITQPSTRFTSALGESAAIISDMDEVMREWGYPMSPEPETVYAQQMLRRDRERSRRFVQAAGTLSRVLGGKLQVPSGVSPLMSHFVVIEMRNSSLQLSRKDMFCYDFIRAVLCWIESGIDSLISAFTRPDDMDASSKAAIRFPIPGSESTVEAIDEYLIPYLLSVAGDRAIMNVEANRFEVDENRRLFNTEKEAVLAFATVVKIPFEDLSSAVILTEGSEGEIHAQDRQTAQRYWVGKVARGLLLNTAQDIKYTAVDRSFGGTGRPLRDEDFQESGLDILTRDLEEEMEQEEEEKEEEQHIRTVEIVDGDGSVVDGANVADLSAAASGSRLERVGPAHDEDDENDEDEDEDEDNLSDLSSEPDEMDGVPRFIYRPAFERRRLRSQVEADIPCSGPTRQYRGHCNVKTVKDVNYFGPDEEYVVSGSDDGNFFIWDRKTSELVNVLEGDGEVVNVIQGHPYETMLAVSGIDHTVKIFSPDSRAREIARLGQGVFAHDPSSFSSISWPPLRSGRRVPRRTQGPANSDDSSTGQTLPGGYPEDSPETGEDDNDDYVAPNGLASRQQLHDAYRIMQHNNMEREEGSQNGLTALKKKDHQSLQFPRL